MDRKLMLALAAALASSMVVVTALVGATQEGAYGFLVGSWRYEKDGMTLTTTIEPALGGAALLQTTTSDDARSVVSRATWVERGDGTWERIQIGRGFSTTFIGAPGDGLLQMTFNDIRFDSPPARLLYRSVTPDTVEFDWQSTDDRGVWVPRDPPFEMRRVDRPAPPGEPGRIAFISNRSGNFEIYTMNPDGSDVVNLSDHPASDHFPVWLGAGSRLAFLSQRDGDEEGGWYRWEVDTDGSDLDRVRMPERLPEPAFGAFPEVSPSGEYVVYVAERDGDQDLQLARFDGGHVRTLAPAPGLDYRPSWSPDGTRIVWVSERTGNAELFVVDVGGTNLRQLTDNPGNDRYAAWSPDGARIAFASVPPGKEQLDLFVMNADGTDRRQLTDNEVEDGEVSWSPDGRYLAFRTDVWGNSEIAVLELATGEITNISNAPDAYDAEPVWSPPLPR